MDATNHRCTFLVNEVKFAVCLLPETPCPRNATKDASEILRIGKIISLLWLVIPPPCNMTTISLRLLALILCSNCSNTFNKVLTTTCRHTPLKNQNFIWVYINSVLINHCVHFIWVMFISLLLHIHIIYSTD